jgi:hypothetical protein
MSGVLVLAGSLAVVAATAAPSDFDTLAAATAGR